MRNSRPLLASHPSICEHKLLGSCSSKLANLGLSRVGRDLKVLGVVGPRCGRPEELGRLLLARTRAKANVHCFSLNNN